ncbi:MAG: hypothetical protein AAB538_00095, partial [Patescibacteria group bacterium]
MTDDYLLDPDYINMLPICGGQEKIPPPEQIVTQNHGSIYNKNDGEYHDWLLTAYRPTAEAAAINFAGGGVSTIISSSPGDILLIVSISLTVADETNITFYNKGVPISGPMDFGGDGEPRGIVVPIPFSPLDLGLGGSFQVGSSSAAQVSGMVCYII